MKAIHLFFLTLFTCLAFINPVDARGVQDSIRPLKIGDKMPDVLFEHMLNYPGGKAKLSDFKGKIVVLDFWNIMCEPCIANFPKMETLQKEFNSKIQVLLVNTFNKVEFLERIGFPAKSKSSIIRNVKLPYVLGSEELKRYFPHTNEPYHVWIDTKGFIRALTSHVFFTRRNITRVLSGENFAFPFERNVEDVITPYQSILDLKDDNILQNTLFTSVITKNLFLPRLYGDILDSLTGETLGMRIYGTIEEIFIKLFLNYDNKTILRDRVLLEVKAPQTFIQPGKFDSIGEWRMDNIYCYELKLPNSLLDLDWKKREALLKRKMKDDIQFYFGVKTSFERKKIKCRVLIRKGQADLLNTSGGDRIYSKEIDGGYVFHNQPFSAVLEFLVIENAQSIVRVPLVDETGISHNKYIDIKLRNPITELEQFRNEINKYGLDIIEEERELEVFVIKDYDYSL